MTSSRIQMQSSASATKLVRDFPAVRRMADHGPVRITAHGRTEAVVLNHRDFDAMISGKCPDDQQSELKLSLTFDAIETYVLVIDEEMVVRKANRVLADSFAMSAEDMVGQLVTNFVANPSGHFIVQRMAAVLESGIPEVLVIPSPRRPDRTMRYHLKPWPGGAALFADDVTEREMMRDKAMAENAADSSLDALAGVGIVHLESNGTIISSGLGLGRMVGSQVGSLAGVRLQSLFDAGSRSIIDEALKDTTPTSRSYRVQYLRDGVSTVPAVLSITPYWTAEHHACAAAVLFDPEYQQRNCRVDKAA